MREQTKSLSQMTGEERAELFPIILSEYNPEWIEWYAEEKSNLERLIGVENIARISHFGSTSVPGLTAKPTVDIFLEIAENVDVETLISSFPCGEYTCLRQQTIPTSDLVLFLKGYTPKELSVNNLTYLKEYVIIFLSMEKEVKM